MRKQNRSTRAAAALLLTLILIFPMAVAAQQSSMQQSDAAEQPSLQMPSAEQPTLATQQPAAQPPAGEDPFAALEQASEQQKPKKLSAHILGVKYGYGMCNIAFDRELNRKGITSSAEVGIFYTYYHSLWNTMPYFGLSVGLQMGESGFKLVNDGYFPPEDQPQRDLPEEEYRYKVIQIPLISQFRVDFWKMRAMLNLGCYGSYKFSCVKEGKHSSNVNKPEVGVIGGGGLAFIFHPVEIHLEANYHYAFSLYFKPETFSERVWYLGHNSRLIFNVGLFFSLDKKTK